MRMVARPRQQLVEQASRADRSSSGITSVSLLKATAPGRNIRRLVRRQAA